MTVGPAGQEIIGGKRMRLAEQTAILGLSLTMGILPAGLAVALVEQARASLIAPQRIHYLKHHPAAKTAAEFQTEPAYRIHEIGRDNRLVPRVFLARLPADLADLPPDQRKVVFASAVLPLVLRVNEMLIEDRRRLQGIRQRTSAGRRIENWEVRWSLRVARIYRTGQPQSLAQVDWPALLRRLDIIPPSLGIAQAANESGWGTSRFAREGNAIFGQWIFGQGPGMIPAQRPQGSAHRVRQFNFLIESVLGYAQNLNTHEAYQEFRRLRAEGRAAGAIPDGSALAATLVNYSVRGEAYVEDIQSIIRLNRLEPLDGAQLITRRGFAAR